MCALVEKSSEPERKTVFFNIRLEPSMHERLTRLAGDHERSVAGEIRHALNHYLAENAPAENGLEAA